jgi:hypothetical protein
MNRTPGANSEPMTGILWKSGTSSAEFLSRDAQMGTTPVRSPTNAISPIAKPGTRRAHLSAGEADERIERVRAREDWRGCSRQRAMASGITPARCRTLSGGWLDEIR